MQQTQIRDSDRRIKTVTEQIAATVGDTETSLIEIDCTTNASHKLPNPSLHCARLAGSASHLPTNVPEDQWAWLNGRLTDLAAGQRRADRSRLA